MMDVSTANPNKLRLLSLLAKNRNTFVKGPELASELNLSRQAVHKIITVLKSDGVEIESTDKGYRLSDIENCDSLSSFFIELLIADNSQFKNCIYLPSTDSTQNILKKLAMQDAPEGIVAVTDKQTAGRGRRGRAWEDKGGKNLIFSLLLRPKIKPSNVQMISLISGIAVCNAVKNYCGLDARLKWPNDVLINGKKFCGILSEAALDFDTIHYVIPGIGINVNLDKSDIPDDLNETATSLFIESGKTISRPALLARILKEYEKLLYVLNSTDGVSEIVELCRKQCDTIGKKVNITQDGTTYCGVAVGITDEGAIVAKINGEEKVFLAADVHHLRDA